MSNGGGSRMAVASLLNSDPVRPTNGHTHHPPPAQLYPTPASSYKTPFYSPYTQPSPPSSFKLGPVNWPGSSSPPSAVKREDSPHMHANNPHRARSPSAPMLPRILSPASDSAPSSSHHTPARQPLELLSDVASRESPAQHRAYTHERLPNTIFDRAHSADRVPLPPPAHGPASAQQIHRNAEEVDELQDDIDIDMHHPPPPRPPKRHWEGDNSDAAQPPQKKRSPRSPLNAPDPMIVDATARSVGPAVATAHQSPRSRARPAPTGRSAKSAEVAKQNGTTPKAKKPRKIRQTDDWKSNPKTPQVGYVFKKVFTADDGTTEELLGELQYSRCMSNRYKNDDFPRCLSCTRRWAGDTCRFQGVRLFYRNGNGDLRGIDFVTALVTPSPEMLYPTEWNVPLTPRHVRLVKEVAARGLLQTLCEEEEHVQKPNIVRRQRETDCRATCDTCLTAVFAGSWICTSCGREACSACHDKVAEICADPKKKKQTLDASPFFLTCTKKQEHILANFRPITRFGRQEIQDALHEMRAFAPTEEELNASLLPGSSAPLFNSLNSPPASLPNGAHREKRHCPPLPTQALGTVSYKDVRLFHHKGLNDANFCELWEKGTPFVVEGLHEKTALRWTPEYLMDKHGGEQCLVVECQNDSNRRLTVEEFFKKFGKYEGRNEILKLKDWPSSTDFKSAFPVLYEDFMNTVPMPDYSRRDGVLNISSHFPFNSVGPDLGPKMYNAFASNLEPGSKGSTRLHMDVADAVNMMQYSEARPDGGDGGAVWDIFSAEDTPKIRNFLKTLSTGKHQTTIDPIHGQTHYLDSALMQQLYDEQGVKSYRIFQRPGQAVFIPAGCAHQVCNLADCIKVAVDFVSPQNIVRCDRLTREFREQNQAQLWKEDMLQLKTMLWYAWLSSSRYDRLPSAPPPLRPAFELPANVPLPVTAAGNRMQLANILPREPSGRMESSGRMAIASLVPHQPQAGPSSSTA